MHSIFIEIYTLLQFYCLFTLETFEDFAFLMTLLPTYTALVVKPINLMYYVDEIFLLMETIQEILEVEKFTEVLKKYLKRIHAIYLIFWNAAVATCMLTIVMRLSWTTIPNVVSLRLQEKIKFWFSVAYQVFDSTCYASVGIVLETLPVFYVLHPWYARGAFRSFGKLESRH